jgi:arsenate reductase
MSEDALPESTLTLYHYAGCSTCRKARKWLAARGLEVELVDLKAAPPTAARLGALLDASGLPMKRFFNTSGQSYRQGGWKDRLPGLDRAEALAALAADGMLIKRPVLVVERDGSVRGVRVGFKEALWAELLEN